MAPRVLLLRTPAAPPGTDRYEAALKRASFRPLSLPVLETAFENLERLSRIVRGEDEEGTVDGVIVTSARAVDACADAGADIDWGAMRTYVVRNLERQNSSRVISCKMQQRKSGCCI